LKKQIAAPMRTALKPCKETTSMILHPDWTGVKTEEARVLSRFRG
jgi:hypothetical protein